MAFQGQWEKVKQAENHVIENLVGEFNAERQKNADLEAENAKLRAQVADLEGKVAAAAARAAQAAPAAAAVAAPAPAPTPVVAPAPVVAKKPAPAPVVAAPVPQAKPEPPPSVEKAEHLVGTTAARIAEALRGDSDSDSDDEAARREEERILRSMSHRGNAAPKIKAQNKPAAVEKPQPKPQPAPAPVPVAAPPVNRPISIAEREQLLADLRAAPGEKQDVVFKWEDCYEPGDATIRGTFSDWKEVPLDRGGEFSDGKGYVFAIQIPLQVGESHSYLFRILGKDTLDRAKVRLSSPRGYPPPELTRNAQAFWIRSRWTCQQNESVIVATQMSFLMRFRVLLLVAATEPPACRLRVYGEPPKTESS
jgi:hypothetical protein